MHTVARKYAPAHGVTLANLMNHMPRHNDPACTAGYAHGLVTGVAREIVPGREGAEAANRACGNAETRYRWLGKTIGVVTDGEFRTTGCPVLPSPAGRKACAAGVRSMEGPLVTFS